MEKAPPPADHVIRYTPRDYTIFRNMKPGDQYPEAHRIAERRFARQLQADGRDAVLISFGKLTVLDTLPNLDTFMLAWSGQPVMQGAAARALVGVTPISARLPVTLPPHHKRGDGLSTQRANAE